MTRRVLFVFLIMFSTAVSVTAQKKIVSAITQEITAAEVEAHLSFLASDEMRGRNVGTPEINLAAAYLAAQLKQYGVKPAPGLTNYYQPVPLEMTKPTHDVSLTLGAETFRFNTDLVAMSTAAGDFTGEIVYVGKGAPENFDSVDVKGKIVLSLTDVKGSYFLKAHVKNALAQSRGAVALVELYVMTYPWPILATNLTQGIIDTKKDQSNAIPHLWLRNSESAALKTLLQQKKGQATLHTGKGRIVDMPSRNVTGIIPGTDATLSQQYVAITCHYDHVGVKKEGDKVDSIYNGARDNAIGTVGILEAAKFFQKHPPKRSILLVAFTAEEKGLLGSKYYYDHPVIPFKQVVFNYNCDGAGYDDKTLTTVIGLKRTTTDALLANACTAFGLKLGGDPAPEQGLYDRSDNVSFARAGVPAINISPGVSGFTEEIQKYYHQPADEVGTLDMNYLAQFYHAYVYAAHLLANDTATPFWTAGDKYEEAGKKLYGK